MGRTGLKLTPGRQAAWFRRIGKDPGGCHHSESLNCVLPSLPVKRFIEGFLSCFDFLPLVACIILSHGFSIFPIKLFLWHTVICRAQILI